MTASLAALMADRRLTGELLLVALGVAYLEQHDEPITTEALRQVTGLLPSMLRHGLAQDVIRYEPDLTEPPTPCIGTTPTGRACQRRRVRFVGNLRQADTGELAPLWACPGHQRDAYDRMASAHRRWVANDKPTPPPNAGGALLSYFDPAWVYALYKWAHPNWSMPPTGLGPGQRVEPGELPRPALRLLRGGLADA